MTQVIESGTYVEALNPSIKELTWENWASTTGSILTPYLGLSIVLASAVAFNLRAPPF